MRFACGITRNYHYVSVQLLVRLHHIRTVLLLDHVMYMLAAAVPGFQRGVANNLSNTLAMSPSSRTMRPRSVGLSVRPISMQVVNTDW